MEIGSQVYFDFNGQFIVGEVTNMITDLGEDTSQDEEVSFVVIHGNDEHYYTMPREAFERMEVH